MSQFWSVSHWPWEQGYVCTWSRFCYDVMYIHIGYIHTWYPNTDLDFIIFRLRIRIYNYQYFLFIVKPTLLRPSFAKFNLINYFEVIIDQPQPNPYDMYFCAGDIMILPSRLLLTRVWCHLIVNMCSFRGQQNLNLTAVWQYDSCGTQGCTYDGVCLFIYGACSTTQGLHAVLLRVGIM